MIRAPIGNRDYWDSYIIFDIERLIRANKLLSEVSKNPVYDPQYTNDRAKDVVRLLLRRYSRGDSICDLAQYFPDALDLWELSNKLSEDICTEHRLKTCRDWTFDLSNLNHYNWCFWLVGLALTLEIPDSQWHRLLVLIGGAGEDELLDRVISSRSPSRKIGEQLLHVRPYGRLLSAIDAPTKKRAALLREFVDNWYEELERKGQEELWWYIYGDPIKHRLERGSYFGRWCLEAVAAVKAFELDDSLCLGHPHYPGDLLRPQGPSIHATQLDTPSSRDRSFGWISRIFRK